MISRTRVIFIPYPFVFQFDVLTRGQAVLHCVVVFFNVEENQFQTFLTVSADHSGRVV
jgi:hypothetical protein